MYQNSGWQRIAVSSVQTPENKSIEGQSIAAIAAGRQVDPFEMILDLIEAENGAVSIISESMNEENMVRFISLPFAMVGSDGSVHKMSGMTARRLGLADTGSLQRGFRADAVVFDPLTFGDTATYDHPQSFPQGLVATIVNGEVVIDGQNHTGAKAGEFYRK